MEQLPPDVIDALTALDPEITPELVQESWALLKPFHEKVGYAAPRIDRDLRYGDDPRHRLDVHTTGRGPAGEPAPVFLFVHGGGFIGGDKHVPGTPMYDHIGAWAVRNGWVGVTMTYRLAPEHTWPAGAEDVAAAVRWVRDCIAGYGGDPDRVVVAGHSAGSVHVAAYLTGQGGGSLNGLLDVEIPLLFAVAERDPQFSHLQVARLNAAWFAKKGTVPHLVWSAGHNHISQIGSIGVDDLALGAQLARFVSRVTGETHETA